MIAEHDRRFGEVEAELHERAAARWNEDVARGIQLDDVAGSVVSRDGEWFRCRNRLGYRRNGVEWRHGADPHDTNRFEPITTRERVGHEVSAKSLLYECARSRGSRRHPFVMKLEPAGNGVVMVGQRDRRS